MSYKVQKSCKICGKMFTPCSDCENDKYAFHWRTVACSMECGMKYFKKIEDSRNPKISTKEKENINKDNTISSDNTIEENQKTKRIRKQNNIKNEESEQID